MGDLSQLFFLPKILSITIHASLGRSLVFKIGFWAKNPVFCTLVPEVLRLRRGSAAVAVKPRPNMLSDSHFVCSHLLPRSRWNRGSPLSVLTWAVSRGLLDGILWSASFSPYLIPKVLHSLLWSYITCKAWKTLIRAFCYHFYHPNYTRRWLFRA